MMDYVIKMELVWVVERKNMTLVEIARTLLIDSVLSMSFQDKVVSMTCYATNRCLIIFLIN